MRQADLAIEFGVSQASVRDALRQLEVDGLVISHPRRGVAVADLSENEINDLIDIKIITPDHVMANNPLVLTNSPMISLIFDIIYATILRDNRGLRQRKLSSDTIINSFQSADSSKYEW